MDSFVEDAEPIHEVGGLIENAPGIGERFSFFTVLIKRENFRDPRIGRGAIASLKSTGQNLGAENPSTFTKVLPF